MFSLRTGKKLLFSLMATSLIALSPNLSHAEGAFTSKANGAFSGSSAVTFGSGLASIVTRDAVCTQLIDEARAEAEQKAMDAMEDHVQKYAEENGYNIISGIELSAKTIGFANSECKYISQYVYQGTWSGPIEATAHAILVKEENLLMFDTDEAFTMNDQDDDAGSHF